MAILIGYVKDGTVYLATDTRINVDDRVHQRVAESDYKIKRLENGILVAMTARERALVDQTMMRTELFTLDKKGRLTKEHIIKEIFPRLYRFYKEEGLLGNEKGEDPYFRGSILIAHEGDLFEICSTFSVAKYMHYQALGSVSDLALYGLTKIDESKDINAQLVEIMETMAKHSQMIGAPYLVINTKDLEYHLLGGKA